MPTRDRLQARADAEAAANAEGDLHVLSDRSGYAAETLRKMMWTPNPPPLRKKRGRWRANIAEFDAWLAARDGEAS